MADVVRDSDQGRFRVKEDFVVTMVIIPNHAPATNFTILDQRVSLVLNSDCSWDQEIAGVLRDF